jgi:hypothetical protein
VIVPQNLADKVQWCDVDHVNRRSKDFGIGEAVTPEVCRVAGQIEAVWGVAYSIKAAADRAEQAAREAQDASRQAWIVAEDARGSATAASTSADEARTKAQEAATDAGEASQAAQGAQEDAQIAVDAALRAAQDAERAAQEAQLAKEQARLARIVGSYQYLVAQAGFLSQRELVVVMGEDGILEEGYEDSNVEERLVLRASSSGTLGAGVDMGFAWPRVRLGTQVQGFLIQGTSTGYGGLVTLYGGRIFPTWEVRAGFTTGASMLAQQVVNTPTVTDAYFAGTLTGLYHLPSGKDDRTFLSVGPSLSVGLNQFATRYEAYEQGYDGFFFLGQLQVQAGGGPADDQQETRGGK